MKWVFLIVGLAAVLPVAGWLRQNPREAPKLWMLLGFMPFALSSVHLNMAIMSWAGWPGYVKGAEFSALDMLALCVFLTLPRATYPVPFRFSGALYLVAVLLSALQTSVPMAALVYAWQLARMFFLFAVVARACEDERFAPALLKGMASGLCFEGLLVIWERFGQGILQAAGTFGHQNLLGMISHFVTFPAFALLLAGESGWLPALVPLAGVIIAVLTTSRGTLGLAAFGYAVVFLLSALRGWSPRKAKVATIGAAAIVLVMPLALSSFERRFSVEVASDYDERAAFESAAKMMLANHPMGVGANNYVVIANTMGYNERAGVTWSSDAAHVHNVYLLVAAETGYLGLVAFGLLLLRPLAAAFFCGWRSRGDPRGDLLLGLGMSLLVVYIQSFFEWVLLTFAAQYMLTMAAGLVAGLAQQLGYWGRAPARFNRPGAEGLVRPSRKLFGAGQRRSME